MKMTMLLVGLFYSYGQWSCLWLCGYLCHVSFSSATVGNSPAWDIHVALSQQQSAEATRIVEKLNERTAPISTFDVHLSCAPASIPAATDSAKDEAGVYLPRVVDAFLEEGHHRVAITLSRGLQTSGSEVEDLGAKMIFRCWCVFEASTPKVLLHALTNKGGTFSEYSHWCQLPTASQVSIQTFPRQYDQVSAIPLTVQCERIKNLGDAAQSNIPNTRPGIKLSTNTSVVACSRNAFSISAPETSLKNKQPVYLGAGVGEFYLHFVFSLICQL
jgi:hypothetical protein